MPDVDLAIGAPPVPPRSDDGEPDVYSEPELIGDPFAGELAPEVPEPVVRGLLATLGTVLAMTPLADGEVPDHWAFTTQELDDITPPLTRIVNARPQLRAAAARGDELTVAIQLAGYVGRNVITGSIAKKARQEQEEDFTYGNVDREADSAAPAGDWGAREAGGWEPGSGFAAQAGVGVNPPSA